VAPTAHAASCGLWTSVDRLEGQGKCRDGSSDSLWALRPFRMSVAPPWHAARDPAATQIDPPKSHFTWFFMNQRSKQPRSVTPSLSTHIKLHLIGMKMLPYPKYFEEVRARRRMTPPNDPRATTSRWRCLDTLLSRLSPHAMPPPAIPTTPRRRACKHLFSRHIRAGFN